MSSGTTIKKKTPKSALERIADLEGMTQSLVQVVNQIINQTNQRLNATAKTLNAIARKLSITPEDLAKVIDEINDEEDAARVEAAQKFIESQVAAGKLESVETIGEKSILVGVEYDAEGKPMKPGRVQVAFGQVLETLKPKLLGANVGVQVETEGGTFEVIEAYDPVDAPPAEEKEDDVAADTAALAAAEAAIADSVADAG